MPYDLTTFQNYLNDATPAEIAQLLDQVLYDLVLSAEQRQDYRDLSRRYLDVLLLRNQFMQMQPATNATVILWK